MPLRNIFIYGVLGFSVIACTAGSPETDRTMASSSSQLSQGAGEQGSAGGADGVGDAVEQPDVERGAADIPENLSYIGFVKNVVDGACLDCHSAGGQAEQLSLGTYAEVAAAIDAMIARTADDVAPMPPQSIEDERALLNLVLSKWKEAGLVESNPEDNNAVAEIAYNDTVKVAIDNACVNCHSLGGQAEFLPLSTYQEVLGAVDSSILRINDDDNPMPPLAGAAEREILAKLLTDWKAQGSLENPPAE